MSLVFRTRTLLALMAGLPVVFLILYPLVFVLLPLRWQEWADLPRDWIVFIAAECLLLGTAAAVAAIRGRREVERRPLT